MNHDPPRLLHDDTAPEELVDAVRAARTRAPTDADLARVALALGVLPPPPPPSAPPPAPPPTVAPVASIGGPIVAALAGLVVAGATGMWALEPSAPRGPARPPAIELAPPVVEEAGGEAPPPIVEAVPATEPERPSPRPRVARVAPAAPAEAPPAPEPIEEEPARDTLREESALIQRASSLLATDPLAALRTANEHRQRYPSGILGQEREVIAIDALLRLGMRRAAEGRASAFESVHAGSVHARRIQRLLANTSR